MVNLDGLLMVNFVSLFFGFIDYIDFVFDLYGDNVENYLVNVILLLGDYNYKVFILKVFFGNLVIQNFNSYVQLVVNWFFGFVVKVSNNVNFIIFIGVYEDQNGDLNYVFNEIGDNLFLFDSNVLNGIEIVKVNFVMQQLQNG